MPAQVEQTARELIEQHGAKAVYIAVEALNQCIDHDDRLGRDFWAQVVQAIHEYQRCLAQQKQRFRRNSKVR